MGFRGLQLDPTLAQLGNGPSTPPFAQEEMILTFTSIKGDFCKRVVTAVTAAPNHTWFAGAAPSFTVTGARQ